MIEILNRCDYLYKNLVDCIDKNTNEHKEGSCLTCTQRNFRRLDHDSYDCLKKLCTYTMFYGPLYVSEIYHFLVQSNFLLDLINEKRNFIKQDPFSSYNIFTLNNLIPVSLNIMSLGCGFGPDDIALNKYRNDYLDLNVNFNYYGFDKEPLWNYITQTNSIPLTCDILDGMNFQNVNILFINKLLSTLKNLRLHNDFFDVFKDALENLPVGSFVIFNDVNHYNEGREDFETFAASNNLQIINRYYFDGHSCDYNHIPIGIIPNILATTPSINPKMHANQTVIFLYQKVLAI